MARNLNLKKEDKKTWLQLLSKVEAGLVFNPSVLSRCGSIQKRYDAKFV